MKKTLLLGASALAWHSSVMAAPSTLDEVVITATRIERPLNRTLAHTTILTREDIQASQSIDLPTLLRSQAGIELTQNGGIGKQSSLFLRGSNSNHTLVLIDGVRVNSATTGATALDQLMLDQVERIEIVRGNVSSIYGSEAIGGVIQIFTRRGLQAPALNAAAAYGSHQSRRASMGYGGKTEQMQFHLQASTYATAGYSAQTASVGNGVNPDADGYRNDSYSGNIDYRLVGDQHLLGSFLASHGLSAYDNAWDTPQDTHDAQTRIGKWSLGWQGKLTRSWQSKLQWAQGEDRYTDFKNGNATWDVATLTHQVSWDNDLQIGTGNRLHFGIESLLQQVSGNTNYLQKERHIDAGFAGFSSHVANHELQLNVRRDRYSDLGDANTWLAAYGLEMAPGWQLNVSASTGFRAPTFNDLYAPAGWGSNPNLKPETSRNQEIGLRHIDDDLNISLNYFDNHIRDLIQADNSWTMQNLAQARIDGWEFDWTQHFGTLRLSANYTLQDPRDEQTGAPLMRRARRFGTFAISSQNGAWHYSGEIRYSDIRQDGGQQLAAYHLLNLALRYRAGRNLEFTLQLDNVFDRDYQLVYGYNTAGRSFLVGISYQQ